VANNKQTKDSPLKIRARRPAGAAAALVVQPPPRPARAVIGLVPPAQPGLKARQLFQEAKRASLDHVSELQSAIVCVQALLDDLIEGGEVYAAGLSEFAVRLKEDLFWRSKTLEALAQRQRLRVEESNQ
jgi:hypothetical protein